jgi:hypothetical protein
MAEERKGYSTTLRTDLIERLDNLAVHFERPHKDLPEAASEDLVKKYARKAPSGPFGLGPRGRSTACDAR